MLAATREHLDALPLFARVAFAARCARRAQTMYAISEVSSEDRVDINERLELAEKLATKPHIVPLPSIQSLDAQLDETIQSCCDNWFLVASKLGITQTVYAASVFAANAAIHAATGNTEECTAQSWRAFEAAALVPLIQIDYWSDRGDSDGVDMGYTDKEAMLTDLNRDLRLLQSLAAREHWTDNTLVAPWFFFPYFQFDINEHFGDLSISEVIVRTNVRLLDYFRRNRQAMHSLSPRQFEELIAHLFDEFGFSVELTSQTRDNGRDIIAIGHHFANVKFLIECKRYALDNPVGISVVQRLHGVTVGEGATKGIIATTARFTKPAQVHLQQHEWILEGRDIDGIADWLRDYEAVRMGRSTTRLKQWHNN